MIAAAILALGVPRHAAPRAGSRASSLDHAAPTPKPAASSAPARATSGAPARASQAWAGVEVFTAGGTPLAPSFLGISTEYWALPLFDGDLRLLERVLSLLRVPGDGPLILRIGGDSADHSFWEPDPGRTPGWVYALNMKWLRRAATLVRVLGARVIIDLNLVTDTPLEAADWARAALADFPRGSIAGFEIGNEPDLYKRSYWLAATAHRWFDSAPVPLDLTADGYTRSFEAYADVLAQVAPRVPLIGPAVAHPVVDASWVSTLLASPHPRLKVVSGHWYPYSACTPSTSASYPTIRRLLGTTDISQFTHGIRPLVRLVHEAGLSFRLTELNSVTCGGLRGVSNAFATALWAPDALFAAARAGVDGVNVHVRARAINGAFGITAGRLVARPLLYGLVLFTRCLGPQARLAKVRVHESPAANLDVWAVTVRRRLLHVLLINRGPRSVSLQLRLPSARPASVERLTAPSPGSISSVSLDGQRLGSDGRWSGAAARDIIAPRRGRYRLGVSRFSAALVSVALLPSPRHGPRLAGRLHPRPSGRRRDAGRWTAGA